MLKDMVYALLNITGLRVFTPSRHGMKSTFMMFAIARNFTKKSPVILPKFAGISSNTTEALQINPWNLGVVAAAMDRGLTMSDYETLEQQSPLYNVAADTNPRFSPTCAWSSSTMPRSRR